MLDQMRDEELNLAEASAKLEPLIAIHQGEQACKLKR